MQTAPRTRRTTKRATPAAKAERVKTLLDDPLVRDAFKQTRDDLHNELERIDMDGSPAAIAAVLAIKAKLDGLLAVQRTILRPLVAQMVAEQGRKRGLN